jgi:hypothetical protein
MPAPARRGISWPPRPPAPRTGRSSRWSARSTSAAGEALARAGPLTAPGPRHRRRSHRRGALELLGGTATIDRAAATRRSCALTAAGFGAILPTVSTIGEDWRFGDGTFGAGTYGSRRRRVMAGLLAVRYTQIHIFWGIVTDGGVLERGDPAGVGERMGGHGGSSR